MKAYRVIAKMTIEKEYFVKAHSAEDANRLVSNLPPLADGVWTLGTNDSKIIVGVSEAEAIDDTITVMPEHTEVYEDNNEYAEIMYGLNDEDFDYEDYLIGLDGEDDE